MIRPKLFIARIVLLSLGLSYTVFAVIPDTRSVQLGAAVVVVMAQDQDPDTPGGGGIVCYDTTPCAGCFALPTSLPALNTITPGSNNLQFESAGGNCGFKRCYWFWYCACGPPLAAAACP